MKTVSVSVDSKFAKKYIHPSIREECIKFTLRLSGIELKENGRWKCKVQLTLYSKPKNGLVISKPKNLDVLVSWIDLQAIGFTFTDLKEALNNAKGETHLL